MNRKHLRLSNILANTNTEKKVAAYAAIGLYLISNDKTIKDYLNGNGEIGKVNNVIRTACFDVNEIGIVDIDLALDVIKKLISSKVRLFDYSKIDVYDKNSTLQDVLGFENTLGVYLEYINKEFEITKAILGMLNRDTLYESLKG